MEKYKFKKEKEEKKQKTTFQCDIFPFLSPSFLLVILSNINSAELGIQKRQEIVMTLALTPIQKRKKNNFGDGFRNLTVEVSFRGATHIS